MKPEFRIKCLVISLLLWIFCIPAALGAYTLNHPIVSMKVGQSTQVDVLAPTGQEVIPEISWMSGNTTVATVDANGLISGVAVGYAQVTATVDGQTLKCVVLINALTKQDNVVQVSYKNKDRTYMHIYRPAGWKATDRRPVVVFFHGGSWSGGTWFEMIPFASYLASRGYVAITAEYGVSSVSETIIDARSCVRWVREQSASQGIDPDLLITGGSSAGAHLATVCYIGDGLDDPADDTSISTKPDLLILFDGALELNSSRYSNVVQTFGAELARNSHPGLDNVFDENAPPAIIMSGTEDYYRKSCHIVDDAYQSLGIYCEHWLAEGQSHGFVGRQEGAWQVEALHLMDRFLVKQRYLSGEPTVDLPTGVVRMRLAEVGGPKKWLIHPQSVVYPSDIFSKPRVERLIDGSGISDNRVVENSRHDQSSSAMLSEDTTTSTFVFDLGESCDVEEVHIWNHHQNGPDTITISVSPDSEYDNAVFSEVTVIKPLLGGKHCQGFAMEASDVRLVKLVINRSSSPMVLAEVRFSGKPLETRINNLELTPDGALNAEVIFDGEASSLFVEKSGSLSSWSLVQPEVTEMNPGVLQVRLPSSGEEAVFYRFGNALTP